MKKTSLLLFIATSVFTFAAFICCSSGGAGGAADTGIEGRVTTFAGDVGVTGSTDFLGGTADAQFDGPVGITSDGTNLYVADFGNSVIRKIVIATGYVSTLAGLPNQLPPYSVDGTGPAARFHNPEGIVYYDGNLYVADRYNHQIRKIVAATGEVTTIAGTGVAGWLDGAGTEAQFNNPFDITTDGTSLFVSEISNHDIRKIVIATGAVTTLAGSHGTIGNTDGTGTAALFKNPGGIVRQGAYLYVADSGNYTIRRINISTKAVTTFAGTGVSGSVNGTGILAGFSTAYGIDTDGTNLYVTDENCIRKVTIAGAVVTTLAGQAAAWGIVDGTGTDARFQTPMGLTPYGGFLYVSDTDNYTIRKVDLATAAVTTIAGEAGTDGSADSVPPRFNNPYDVAYDGENLYVCDTHNHTIRKAVISTGVVTTLAGLAGTPGSADSPAARFIYPSGIATDGTNLFVSDTANHTIRQIVIATGAVSAIAGTAGSPGDGADQFNNPWGIVCSGTDLYVVDSVNHTIKKIDTVLDTTTTIAGSSGKSGSADGTGATARFHYPSGMTMIGGDLYVADTYNDTIRKVVAATGVVTTVAGSPLNSGDADGVGSAARFREPGNLTTDGTDLYVSDTSNHTIRKIVLSSAAVTTPAGLADTSGTANGTGAEARFYEPRGIAFDGTYLYVADAGNHAIRRIE